MQVTREQLEGYQKLMREIAILGRELEDMAAGEAGLGDNLDLNSRDESLQPQSSNSFAGDIYIKKRRCLALKEEEAMQVLQWVEEIEDPETRLVFKYFYVDGLKWKEIAQKLGYRDHPDYPRLYIRDAYQKKME